MSLKRNMPERASKEKTLTTSAHFPILSQDAEFIIMCKPTYYVLSIWDETGQQRNQNERKHERRALTWYEPRRDQITSTYVVFRWLWLFRSSSAPLVACVVAPTTMPSLRRDDPGEISIPMLAMSRFSGDL
jgi:hypothetical protein